MDEIRPDAIIQRLRQTIKTGKLGKDYTIIPRDKNNRIREKYLIDDDKVKGILNSLTVDDYICSEESNHEDFPDDIVHKFEKNISLIRRNCNSLDPEDVCLYIKFTWTRSITKVMIIISFHD